MELIEGRVVPAIEDPRNHGGWFVAFWKTVLACFFYPRQLFTAIAVDNPEPNYIFGGVCTYLGVILQLTLSWLLTGKWSFFDFDTTPLSGKKFLIGLVFLWMLSPLFIALAVITICVEAALLHAVTFLFAGDTKRGFKGTARVVCYTRPLALIPSVFLWIEILRVLWAMGLATFGLAKMHKLPIWRVAIAVGILLLIFFVIGCIFGVVGGMLSSVAPSIEPTGIQEVG